MVEKRFRFYPPSASTTGPIALPRAKAVSMGTPRKPGVPMTAHCASIDGCWERQARAKKPDQRGDP